METKQVLNAIAGALFVAAFIPYIRAILRKETKPAKTSWLIWASLDTITIAGMFAKDAVNGQILGAVMGGWIVAGLALKYGQAGWTALDKFCLGGAVIGVALWQTLNNPVLAIMTSLCVISFASIPTFVNAYHKPKSENRTAWTIYFLSCVVALFAIPHWTFEDAAQPITFTIIETTMVCLLWFPRQPKK